MIGAGALVRHYVPAYCLVYGVPAVQKGWVSRAGYKLTFNKEGKAFCLGTAEPYLISENTVHPI